MKITITLKADRILEILKNTPEYATALVEQAVTDSCLLVERRAKQLCPVDTGRLRSSITHEVKRKPSKEISGRIGTNVKYAPYVEFGTGRAGGPYPAEAAKFRTGYDWKGHKKSDFLYPAFRASHEETTKKVTEAVREAVKRMGTS